MRIPAAALALVLWAALQPTRAVDAIHWQPWSPQVFAAAKAEQRFVLLDLEAVWCHWCHVMDEQTYSDPAVIALMNKRYVAVKVDQDSDPALSDRYGDWGWPATIVFAADGSEIVKRQGYMPPPNMASLLQAIIDDPSPGPSVRPETPVQAAATGALPEEAKQALLATYRQAYDAKYGGWGDLDKYIDAYAMEYAFNAGDAAYAHMAQQTLDSARALIDPVWGGVDQYSVSADWKTPHYEKIVSIQADYLRVYSEAYTRWHRPQDLAAARAVRGYLDAFLRSPAGAFYVSQDADLDAQLDGGSYYKLDDAARRKLGVPRVDTHVYARENGWVVRALTAYYAATGDAAALAEAEAAARQVRAQQSLPGGGYSHGAGSKAGPYLGDSLAMADAYLALYGASGDRGWLAPALQALDFIQQHFNDGREGGYMTAPVAGGAAGVFKESVRLPEENADLARVADLAYAYSGDARYRRMQQHAMAYLASPALTGSGRFLPAVLLADAETRGGPLHVTVVGHKDDAGAQALHVAALAYPAVYKQLDWWDKREGALPNPEVTYPELTRAAAFVCTGSSCSSPIFDPVRLAATIDRLTAVAKP
ncbi:MAG TPA: DUF255 domain-containing protein [Gammaproteobacteria bacterium]|nr:DUF255 domain-containing protein [Gammaproteobacteria bacterium]